MMLQCSDAAAYGCYDCVFATLLMLFFFCLWRQRRCQRPNRVWLQEYQHPLRSPPTTWPSRAAQSPNGVAGGWDTRVAGGAVGWPGLLMCTN